MTLRHLEIFVTVCENNSISLAAKKLYVAQPYVSTAIKNLENHYGVKLFDRMSKKLYLTELGKQFLEQARHIVSLYKSMEDDVKNGDTHAKLRVGSSITIGNCLMPQFVNNFNNKFKKIEVYVSINSSHEIERKVLTNEIDIALIEGIPRSEHLLSEPFMNDHLTVICPKDHSFAKKQEITLEQLIEAPLILREPGSGTRQIFDNTLELNFCTAKPFWECISTQAIVNAVQCGIGISVLPYRLVKNELRHNSVASVKVKDIEFKRKFFIIYHKNKHLSNAIREFINICKACY